MPARRTYRLVIPAVLAVTVIGGGIAILGCTGRGAPSDGPIVDARVIDAAPGDARGDSMHADAEIDTLAG